TAADLFCKVRIRLGGYLRLRHCVQIFRHGTLLSSCGVGRGPTREGRTLCRFAVVDEQPTPAPECGQLPKYGAVRNKALSKPGCHLQIRRRLLAYGDGR